MKTLPSRIIFVCAALCLFLCNANAQVPTANVGGVVLNQQQIPMPGLTVYLVHPIVGRSYPCYTDNLGRYVFYNVPIRPDTYYIEVYWGKQLYYRGTLVVAVNNVVLPPIYL